VARGAQESPRATEPGQLNGPGGLGSVAMCLKVRMPSVGFARGEMPEGLAPVRGTSPYTSKGAGRPYRLALSRTCRATGADTEILDTYL
jgi:hypothetical protein